MNLETLFNPKSVAVIGAADDPGKLGYALFANLLSNKKRIIYPVNPAYKKVQNHKCFSSVKDIPNQIDMVIIAVKPEIVPLVLKDCGEKKVTQVIIITAGYKEIGLSGEKREKELISLAKQYKINLVGPNCLGIMNINTGLNATFGNALPQPGGVAFISQSGALGTAMLDWAEKKNIGFSKFISLGNAAGLQENDFIEYLENDKNTSAIVLYLEGLSDGKKFLQLCRRITPKKPVVVIKAGRSEKGSKAVSSHTGSLAPSYEIFKTACRQSGVILVESLGEMFDLVSLFNVGLKKMPYEWVILTNGGGPSIIATDLIEDSSNLSLMDIPLSIKQKLQKVLPLTAALSNPIDLVGDALSDRYENALKLLTSIKKDFGIIVLLTPQKVTPVLKIAQVVNQFKNKKIILPLFIGGRAIVEADDFFTKQGLVNFNDPGDLIKAISFLAPEKIKSLKFVGQQKKLHNLKFKKIFSYQEVANLFSNYNLKLTGILIDTKNDLHKIKTKIDFPWAMKLISPDAIHKTEAGAVKVDISNIKEAIHAYETMMANLKVNNPQALIEGVVVQPMIKGREIIVGLKKDPTFGQIIVFGLGGIFTEIIKDVSMRLCPVSEKEAIKMINEIKSSPVFYGARGEKPLAVKSLAKVISAISRLAVKEKNISELDLNPIIITDKGVNIVDVRVIGE